MPSIRENVRNLFPGPRMRSAFEQARQRAEDIAGVLDDVFTHRAYYLTGEQDMKAEELDSRALANLRRRSQWIPITGGQADDQDEALRRDEIVPISRRMQRWDPLTKRIVATWTDFGFGQDVLIMPEADDVKKWWSEYWTALRNRPILGARELHKLSDKTLVDGEFFFVYFTDRNTGQVTTRTIDTLEITEFITLPSDNQTVLYYKRQWQEGDLAKQKTVYYPHWLATDEQLAKADLPKDAALAQEQDNGIDKEDDTIDVDMMQVALTSQTKRGWPLMAASQDWNRAYIDFLQNRAAVARSVATYVDRVRVDGGSRAVTSFTSLLQSSLVTDPNSGETNPVPAAGSTAITNKAVNWDRFNMSSGAQDAKADGAMLFNMVGIGAGLFPHWLGHGESFRLATACYSSDTVYLSEFGWKHYWEWQDGEKIASYNQDSQQMEYIVPTALHVYPYDGDMLSIKTKRIGFDVLVTPNHRMLIQKDQHGYGKSKKKWDWDIVRADSLPSSCYLPASAPIGDKPDMAYWVLPETLLDSPWKKRRRQNSLIVPMDPFLAFVGWWLAEGSITKRKNCLSYSTQLALSTKATDDVDEIDRIISELPFKFNRYITENGTRVRWECSSHQLYKWLNDNCGKGAQNKRMPSFAFQLNQRQARLLLDALWAGDGSYHRSTHYIGSLASSSTQLLDDAQRLMLHLGEWGSIALLSRAGKDKGGGFHTNYDCYVLHRSQYDRRCVRKRHVSTVPYDGSVWCFEVPPNGMFITRRNGQPLIAGNTAMETPTLRNFERYQRFWQSVWQDMYDHVLAMAEKHGGQNFQEKGVEIALDPLLQTNLSELATAIEQVKDVPEIALPPKELTRLFLQALKIEDVEDFIAKEFPEDDAGQERAAVKVADLAAMRELLKEAGNGGGLDALQMAGEAFVDSLR